MLNTIKGSVNLITGCGRGLGMATLKRFLDNNCGPTLCIDQYFESGFQDRLGLTGSQREKLTITTHNTFDDRVEESIEEFVSRNGAFDNILNIAGVALGYSLYSAPKNQTYGLKHVNSLNDFNIYGTFNIIRLATKFMVNETSKSDRLENSESKQNTRCILNTSCISTTSPSGGQTYYAASKGAIDSMTLCIARELSPFNIRCNTINVGYFDTDLLRSNDHKVRLHIASQINLCPSKLGHPEEFAQLVQTIVENQMINGACIRIDAGARDPAG